MNKNIIITKKDGETLNQEYAQILVYVYTKDTISNEKIKEIQPSIISNIQVSILKFIYFILSVLFIMILIFILSLFI